MMGSSIDGDHGVLARTFELLRQTDTRSGGGPVVKLAGVDPYWARNALALWVHGIAEGIEGKERSKGWTTSWCERFLGPNG